MGHFPTVARFLLRRPLVVAVFLAGVAGGAPSRNVMVVQRVTYELRAGETEHLSAPPETRDFLVRAASRRMEIVNGNAPAGAGFVAAPTPDGGGITLAASLRTPPGQYTVKLAAATAAGERRETTLTLVVKPLVTVPSNSVRPPVVLLNGWVTGFTNACPIANSSAETFGNLAQYLVNDGVPVVYLFDNCREDPGQSIEGLGNDLGAFLKLIKYDNGAQVPQIDLVGFSMGGLIARAYLSGLQPNQTLAPPATTLVRRMVLIATPSFGSFVAGNYATAIAAGSQAAEMIPGSSLLWNLATWNQRVDDLRGVDAIAVIGNAGTYTGGLSSGTLLSNASDGLVSLASASLGFVSTRSAVTRIVPYCHVDPQTFTNTGLGAFSCNAPGIANVTDTSQLTGQIVRSFLAGTADWSAIGGTPASDPFLSKNGAMFFTLSSSAGSYVTDLSSVTFGSVSLFNGALANTVYYGDFLFGAGTLTAVSRSLGSVNCGSFSQPLGYTAPVRCKFAATIISVGPYSGQGGRTVNGGSPITITGASLGGQCTACKVVATPAGSSSGVQLTPTSWSNTSIVANLPASLSGLITLQVFAASGTDAIAVMVNPQSALSVAPSSLQFTYTTGGDTPPPQTIQITNSGSGSFSWTAAASDPWLSVSSTSGTPPFALSVSIVPAGLSAGTYTGSVQIAAAGASNTPVSVGVTVIVTDAAPALVAAPQSLAFEYSNGGAPPPAQNLTVSNAGGGQLAWTATASAYWLVVSPAAGAAPASLSVSLNPVNLAAGTYSGTVQIAAAGAATSPAQIAVILVVTGNPPAGSITAVANAASFLPAFTGGTWLSIFGASLSQSTYAWQAGDFVNGALPASLQGVSVKINGVEAYVAYISPTQINVLAPDDTQTGNVQVQVTAGQPSNVWTAPRTQFAPAFFTFAGAYVAALHADFSVVAASGLLPGVTTQPARPGETILLYGTGFGPTAPPLPSAQLVSAPEPLASPVEITIGGTAAAVTFAGLVGPGLYQFNVTVPNLPNGDAAVVAKVGGVSSQSGVAVSVQQ